MHCCEAQLWCIIGLFCTILVLTLSGVVIFWVEMNQDIKHFRMHGEDTLSCLFANFMASGNGNVAIHLDMHIDQYLMRHAAGA